MNIIYEGAPGTFRRRGQAIVLYWLAVAAAMTLAMAVWRNGGMQRRFVAKDIIVVFHNGAFSHQKAELTVVRPTPAKVEKLMLDAVIDDTQRCLDK